jgi:hypothetical protein
MIIQAHLGITVALCVILGWRKKEAVGKIWHLLSNFSAQNILINSHQAQKIELILFIISQWVYQMIIQAHLGIIVAWNIMLGLRKKKLLARFGTCCPTFHPKTT